MKVVKLFIISFFFCYAAQSQVFQPVNTPIKWKLAGFDSLFIPTHDTIPPRDKTKAWMTVKDTTLYVWKTNKWVPVSGASGNGGGETNSGTVAQLRALSTTTGRSYTATGGNGGSFTDIGPYDGQFPDDGAIYLVTANNKVLKRQINGEVYPEWWGAIVNDNISDTAAFGKMTRFCNASNFNIKLSAGTYNLRGVNSSSPAWLVPGRTSNGSAIQIRGAGSRSTILKATIASVVLQYGTASNDVLNGVVSDIRIDADSTIDGIHVVSNAPTSGAFNSFNNIFIVNVKKGIDLVANVSNMSSNYRNQFDNIDIQGHWGVAINVSGVYCSFKHVFVVAPSGGDSPYTPTASKGANTLAFDINGANNLLEDIQTEDQININGNDNKLTGVSMEFILKGTPYTSIGATGIRIAGNNNTIDGLKMSGFNKNVITYLGTIYGTNTSIKNVSYSNLADATFNVLYPLLPLTGSSGTMDNVKLFDTSIHSVFFLDNASFASGMYDWSLRNIIGANGIFSRDNHLTIAETDALSLHLTGGAISGYTYLNGGALLANGSVATGSFYDLTDGQFGLNKAGNGYLAIKAKDGTGSENVWNYDHVGTVNPNGLHANFGGTVSGSKATQPTDLLRKDQADSLYAASTFILRNSLGTGDTIMKVVTPGVHVAMKTILVDGASVTRTVTDTTIKYSIDGIITGLGTLNGNASQTVFDIVLPFTPTWVGPANPANAASVGITYCEPITNGMRIHFATAPPAGSANVNFYYQYK